MRIAHRSSHDPVYGITTADQSHTGDITRRQKQYILTMLVRIVSIVVVVAVPGISWPVKILLCVVATVIPYVAAVRANGGPAPEKDPTNLLLSPPGNPALGWEQRGLPGAGPVVAGEADETADADEAGDSGAAGGTAEAHGADEHRGDADPVGHGTRVAPEGDATNSHIYSGP